MVIQLDQVARPVRTDPASVEVPLSVEVGAVPGHRIQGAARAGMTVGPLSIQLAGAPTTAISTATHEQAILKIQFSTPRAIFENFKI
jgi:ABC-type cobalamin transport system ATPase subunit